MATAETVSCAPRVRCEVTRSLTAACPITDETDHYDVTVAWTTDGATYEKHALADAIDSYSGVEETQEAIAAGFYDDLRTPGVTDLEVTVRDTEHMDMVVTKV